MAGIALQVQVAAANGDDVRGPTLRLRDKLVIPYMDWFGLVVPSMNPMHVGLIHLAGYVYFPHPLCQHHYIPR